MNIRKLCLFQENLDNNLKIKMMMPLEKRHYRGGHLGKGSVVSGEREVVSFGYCSIFHRFFSSSFFILQLSMATAMLCSKDSQTRTSANSQVKYQ